MEGLGHPSGFATSPAGTTQARTNSTQVTARPNVDFSALGSSKSHKLTVEALTLNISLT